MKYFIGIDEAGWGPVIGPLVIAGIKVEKSVLSKLKKSGVKDSKEFGEGLSAREKRTNVWKKISQQISGYHCELVSAKELDEKNLVNLIVDRIAEILNTLNWKKAEKIYIGMVGQLKKENLIFYLNEILKSNISPKSIVYEKKADKKYLPVATASILAKINRDREMENICQNVGIDYISGYPNQRTAKFLQDYWLAHHSLPPEVRISRKWLPLERILNETKRIV